MKFDQVKALIEAHVQRNETRFHSTVLRIAAGMRSASSREQLTRLAERMPQTMQMLPPETKGLIYELPRQDLEEVWLPEKVREDIELLLREHRHFGALAAKGLSPRRRILLCGPPGNGKTMTASALAQALGVNGYGVMLSQVRGSLMGETASKVHKALAVINHNSLLLLDEVDVLAQTRSRHSDGASRESNAVVATLLQVLDMDRPGILLAATNRPDMLDPAIRRRFDVAWELPQPEPSALLGYGRSIFEKHQSRAPLAWDPQGQCFATVEQEVRDIVRREILEGVSDEPETEEDAGDSVRETDG